MKNVKKMLTQHKSEILPDEKVKDNILYVVCIVPLQSGKNRVRGGDENER